MSIRPVKDSQETAVTHEGADITLESVEYTDSPHDFYLGSITSGENPVLYKEGFRGSPVLFDAPITTQPSLPQTYQLDQRVLSWTTTFDIVSGGANYGNISAKLISLTPTFTYQNSQGQKVATGSARFIAIGSTIDIYDAQGALLGTVKEKIFQSWGISSQYEIKDAQGNVIAISDKFQLGATSFTIRDNSGKNVATIERPWINLTGDTWTVKTGSSTAVDPRIVAMIAPFKTFSDQQRSSE